MFWNCVFATFLVSVSGVEVNLRAAEPRRDAIVLHASGDGVQIRDIHCGLSEYEDKSNRQDLKIFCDGPDGNLRCRFKLLHSKPVSWILCDVKGKKISAIQKAVDRYYYVVRFSTPFDVKKFRSNNFTAKQLAIDKNVVHFTSIIVPNGTDITGERYNKTFKSLKVDIDNMIYYNTYSIDWIRNVKFCPPSADNIYLKWNESRKTKYITEKCVGYYFSGYFLEAVKVDKEIINVISNISTPKDIEKNIPVLDAISSNSVELNSTTKRLILETLDSTVSNLKIPGNTYQAMGKNLAIGIMKLSESKTRGLYLKTDGDRSLSFINQTETNENVVTKKISLGLELPEQLFQDPTLKLNAILFGDSKALFESKFTTSVISVTVSNSSGITLNLSNLISPITLWFKRSKEFSEPGQCVFWDFKANGGQGDWSTEGCLFNQSIQVDDGFIDECMCTHLTHFGSIFLMGDKVIDEESKGLEMLSIIGCSISLLGLCGVFITAAGSPQWRKGAGQKILLQMAISLAFLMVMFLLALTLDIQKENRIGCIFMGFFMHYAVLVNFFWMLVAGYLQYKRLVQVISHRTPKLFSKSSFIAWGIPLIPGFLIIASTHWDEYNGSKLCLPRGITFNVTILTPVVAILLANSIIFCLILKNIFTNANDSPRKHEDSANKNIRVIKLLFFLFVLLGLSWIFALCQYIPKMQTVFSLLFNLAVTFQGMTYFVYMVLFNKNARAFWSSTFENNHEIFSAVSFANHPNRDQTVSVISIKNLSSSQHVTEEK